MSSIYDLDVKIPEPYNVTQRDPQQALAQIEHILSRCSGSELCIIAEVLTALKGSLDNVLR